MAKRVSQEKQGGQHEAEQALSVIKVLIAGQPEDKRERIVCCEQSIRNLIERYPDGEALTALTLIALECQCEP